MTVQDGFWIFHSISIVVCQRRGCVTYLKNFRYGWSWKKYSIRFEQLMKVSNECDFLNTNGTINYQPRLPNKDNLKYTCWYSSVVRIRHFCFIKVIDLFEKHTLNAIWNVARELSWKQFAAGRFQWIFRKWKLFSSSRIGGVLRSGHFSKEFCTIIADNWRSLNSEIRNNQLLFTSLFDTLISVETIYNVRKI